jgi:hypothetical protein
MRVGVAIDPAIDCEGRPSHRLLRHERPQLHREREVPQSHGSHHIVNDARVAVLQSSGDIVGRHGSSFLGCRQASGSNS